MSVEFGRVHADRSGFGRRALVALIVVVANVAAVLSCYAFDILGVFGSQIGASCVSIGVADRACALLTGEHIPKSLVLMTVVMGMAVFLGRHNLRQLVFRLEQNRRSYWWLIASAAGSAIFLSPYLLDAAGISLSPFSPLASFLLVFGATIGAAGLLLWLLEAVQLREAVSVKHVLFAAAIVPVTFAASELLDGLAWDTPAIKTAAFNTTIFFLHLLGQTVVSDLESSMIGIGDFRVTVGTGCSGVVGVVMVTAVMLGYALALRKQLYFWRALILVPFAAALSWVLNGVRIASLLMIGAKLSPELAVEGFHTNAGWLSFCALSALMLFVAENTSWIHKGRTAAVSASKASATPILNDPAVAQLAPFAVLLISSLIAGAIFIHPESGYPLRFALMAASVLLFAKSYRAEIVPVNAVPFVIGTLVAVLWLGIKAGGPQLTAVGIVGPVSQIAVISWVFFRVAGTVLLVPFIEEMFFRGYLLRRLDFGGMGGKAFALAASSVLFGALHADIWLASISGLVFAFLALRRNRVFDAVVAHATANGIIAAWAVWADNWSVI